MKYNGSSWILFPGDFVNAHGLQLGDFIMVYQDLSSNTYVRYTLPKKKSRNLITTKRVTYKSQNFLVFWIQVIQARKASEEEEDVINVEEDDVYTDLTRIENTVVNDFLLQDYNHQNNNNNNICSYYYPIIDDVTTTTSSFVYDSTALTSNDTPLDFLGGLTTTSSNNYYSKYGSFEGLGSVENISLDDFYWSIDGLMMIIDGDRHFFFLSLYI